MLPLDSFYKKLDGKSNYCKSCTKKNSREHSKLKWDSSSEYRQTKNDEKIARKWGMTSKEYNWKLEAQDFQCAICNSKMERGRLCHLDHNHKTGEIRDFLCSGCNTGLGQFQDNPIILQAAINYIKRHNECVD